MRAFAQSQPSRSFTAQWAVLALAWLGLLTGLAQADVARRVLVLHSYHQGYPWTDAVQKGLDSVFDQSADPVEVDVEYIDAKRHPGKALFGSLSDLLAAKYGDHQPDVIVSSDNDALEFLFAYRNQLFPGVPVVFSGLDVNEFDPNMLAGRSGYTGVVERQDLGSTVELILRLQPHIERIVVVNDRTTSGLAVLADMKSVARRYADQVEFVYLDEGQGLTREELLAGLRAIEGSAAVYFLGFFRDRLDTPLAARNIIPTISSASPVPVYSYADAFLGYGIVGGKLLCGDVHGRSAGQMAVAILSGTPVSELPVRVESSNRYLFDYRQLKRFPGLDDRLPPGSEVRHGPAGFFERNRTALLWVGAVLVFLAILSIFLIANTAYRWRTEKILAASEERYRWLANNATDMISRHDYDGRYTYVSPMSRELLGYEPEELVGRDCYEFFHPDDVAKISQHHDVIHNSQDVQSIAYRLHHKDGQYVWVESTSRPVQDPQTGEITGNISVTRNITERMEAQARLQEQHEIMDYVIRHDPNAVAVYDSNLHYVYVSQRYLEDYGIEDPDIIGKHHYEVFPEMPQRWKDVHRRVLNGAIERAEQDGFQRPDGSFTWNRWECRPWYHADGSIAGIITYTEVITERVEAEHKLRESEERYRRLVENSPNILYIFSPDRGGVYWSRRVEDILGWSPEQLAESPRAWHDAIHPEDRPIVDRAIRAAAKSSQPYNLEYRIRDAGGRLHWLHDRFIGIRIEGDDRLIEGLASDITQRKVAEQSLRESRQLLADAERLAAIGAWGWDVQTDQWTLSENLRNILGASSLSMNTDKLMSFAPEEDRPRIRAAFERALSNEGRYEVEHRIVREDTGETRTIRAVGEVETDPAGQPLRMIGASQDITERLRLERSRRELEQQIESARRQESLTRMAGAIAHNFNNTLMGVMGNLSLVLENAPEDDNHELLADAQASAVKAAELSRLMLLYVGQGHKSHRPFSLTQLLRDNRENLRQLIPDEVELSINLPEADKLEIPGNRTRVYEAIRAVVINAGEAVDTPQGRVNVSLKRRNLTRDELARSSVVEKPNAGEYLTITVSDTGAGMDSDVMERMFDPYFSTKFTGRGLGLAIAMGVVRRHRGAILVDSTPGEGSRIELLLPTSSEDALDELAETSHGRRV